MKMNDIFFYMIFEYTSKKSVKLEILSEIDTLHAKAKCYKKQKYYILL